MGKFPDTPLKSVVKNAFQATQAEIASNMPAPSSPSLLLLSHKGVNDLIPQSSIIWEKCNLWKLHYLLKNCCNPKGAFLKQRSVWPVPQSVAFVIVSRCFENKTIIVEKQNLAKMPFVYYLQIYKSISDNSAAWMSWQQGC